MIDDINSDILTMENTEYLMSEIYFLELVALDTRKNGHIEQAEEIKAFITFLRGVVYEIKSFGLYNRNVYKKVVGLYNEKIREN